MPKIVFCNNDITDIHYSGYTITKVYGCDGQLVYDANPTPTENWKIKAKFETDLWGEQFGYKDCDSSSAITSSETKTYTVHLTGSTSGTWVGKASGVTNLWIGDCVKEIGNDAFKNSSSLTLVNNMGNNVETIGDRAFSGCTALTAVYIGCNTKTIGTNAFYGCSGMTTLNICDGVQTIRDGAFMNCSSLTSVTIPSSVTYIGRMAFMNCTNLQFIRVNASCPTGGDTYTFYNTNNCPICGLSSVCYNDTSSWWFNYKTRMGHCN